MVYAVDFSRFCRDVARRLPCLLHNGNGQEPKTEILKDVFGAQAGDRNIHVVVSHRSIDFLGKLPADARSRLLFTDVSLLLDWIVHRGRFRANRLCGTVVLMRQAAFSTSKTASGSDPVKGDHSGAHRP